MRRLAPAVLVAALLALVGSGCNDDERDAETDASGTRTGTVPRPERFIAREIDLIECEQGSGSRIRVAGMTCAEAAPITKDITTSFADENLRKEVVERGNGWRCFQRLFRGGAFVELVCWRGDRQVLIFQKG